MPPHQPPNPSTTLTTTKSTFLTRQILLLSTPLNTPQSQPPSSTSTTTLPPTTTTPLLEKINKKITSHNRLHFPLQTQRHILEQVESIYWRDVLASGLPVTKSETLVGQDVDFTNTSGIQSLEGGWEGVILTDRDRPTTTDEQAQERDRLQENRFTSLHSTLRAQITRRDHLRQKARALKELRRRLEPFEKPKENIQPNLVGIGSGSGNGNGEIEAEIARMRVLLVRAEGVLRDRQGQGKIQGRRVRSGDREEDENGEVQRESRTRNNNDDDVMRVQDLLEFG